MSTRELIFTLFLIVLGFGWSLDQIAPVKEYGEAIFHLPTFHNIYHSMLTWLPIAAGITKVIFGLFGDRKKIGRGGMYIALGSFLHLICPLFWANVPNHTRPTFFASTLALGLILVFIYPPDLKKVSGQNDPLGIR